MKEEGKMKGKRRSLTVEEDRGEGCGGEVEDETKGKNQQREKNKKNIKRKKLGEQNRAEKR